MKSKIATLLFRRDLCMKFDVKSDEGVVRGGVKDEDCVKGCHQQRRGLQRATGRARHVNISERICCVQRKATFTISRNL